jgi:hypothetical protein
LRTNHRNGVGLLEYDACFWPGDGQHCSSTMKKTIKKLALRQETLRMLVETELVRVAGGQGETSCPWTALRSGCPSGQADNVVAAIRRTK